MTKQLVTPKYHSEVYYTIDTPKRRQINSKSEILGIKLVNIDEVFADWEKERKTMVRRVYPEKLDSTRKKISKELLNKFMEAGVKSFSSNRETFTWMTGLAYTGWIVEADLKIFEEQTPTRLPKHRSVLLRLNEKPKFDHNTKK